ncbi:Ternary complex factor MIP1 leucine-zipper [Arabidopsis suecica]|uniref:Ternary complex factor MIP1 leucine-zipper n=1 Tax=Arabidopsis suecica TaxID=45249 RepID=A0A8T2CHU6_ARASU|nr:Ternary complex factor MIP1 leucine-zipper [Arabidopsis suecica]
MNFYKQTRKCEKMMGLCSPSPSSNDCSSSSPRNWEKQNVIVASPARFSTYTKPSVSIEKRLLTYQDSNCNVMPKSSEDLRKEIASLEFEILRTEQYLLSLYRTAFDEQVSSFSPHTETSLVSNQFCPKYEQSDVTSVFSYHYQASPASECSSSCPPRSFQASLKALSAREKSRYVSGNHTTLGDLLGSSLIVDNIVNPSRLSEDILRCICSVYCTLSSKARTNSCLQASSSSPSSVSSKPTFDSWNSRHEERKEANVPGVVVIESLELHLDDGSFNHAALMLQHFRSLVQKLEKVDPSRMKREEKLAFWINIHNALTMHAYLAYGTHNRARNTSVLKAAYDVGGYRVNPYIIQSSILGIRPHFSQPVCNTLSPCYFCFTFTTFHNL